MNKDLQKYLDLFKSNNIDAQLIKIHIEQQSTIDQYLPQTASFFYLAESPSNTYHFMGRQQEVISGYSNDDFTSRGIELFLECLHPEDRDVILTSAYPLALNAFHDIAKERHLKFQMQYNYRFKRKTGEYINLLEQTHVLEVDENERPSLLLGNVICLDNPSTLPVRLCCRVINNGVSETVVSKTFANRSDPLNLVSEREMEILRNLASGKSSREIGKELYISPHTVDTHRRNLLKKLKCKSVVEMTRLLFTNGML